MAEITRSQLAVYAVIALGIVLLGGRYLTQQHQGAGSVAPTPRGAGARPAGPEVQAPSTRAAAGVVVHVAGAVRHPGVYRVRAQGRVRDAVRRAGGATAQGDANAVNLAAKVADGQQVVIPRRAPIAPTAAAPGAGAAPAGSAPGSQVARTPISLSSATPEQLQELDGVGPATADKIVAWRTEHGGFRSIDDLGQVPGIGAKRLATLRPLVQP
jgi:competence protein ComEA